MADVNVGGVRGAPVSGGSGGHGDGRVEQQWRLRLHRGRSRVHVSSQRVGCERASVEGIGGSRGPDSDSDWSEFRGG